MSDAFVLAADLAAHILRSTEAVWTQGHGEAVPVDRAHARLFGAPPGVPLWLAAIEYEGRVVVLRLYPRGRVHVYDPRSGSSIRVLRRVTDESANLAAELSHHNPQFARYQRDRSQSFAVTGSGAYFAKIGGAAQGFFQSK